MVRETRWSKRTKAPGCRCECENCSTPIPFLSLCRLRICISIECEILRLHCKTLYNVAINSISALRTGAGITQISSNYTSCLKYNWTWKSTMVSCVRWPSLELAIVSSSELELNPIRTNIWPSYPKGAMRRWREPPLETFIMTWHRRGFKEKMTWRN